MTYNVQYRAVFLYFFLIFFLIVIFSIFSLRHGLPTCSSIPSLRVIQDGRIK
jgi:hypothetical protein